MTRRRQNAGGTPGVTTTLPSSRNYLRVEADFAKYFGKSPDKFGPNELRTYQASLLRERKLTPGFEGLNRICLTVHILRPADARTLWRLTISIRQPRTGPT